MRPDERERRIKIAQRRSEPPLLKSGIRKYARACSRSPKPTKVRQTCWRASWPRMIRRSARPCGIGWSRSARIGDGPSLGRARTRRPPRSSPSPHPRLPNARRGASEVRPQVLQMQVTITKGGTGLRSACCDPRGAVTPVALGRARRRRLIRAARRRPPPHPPQRRGR
jgi:hypothetical protein